MRRQSIQRFSSLNNKNNIKNDDDDEEEEYRLEQAIGNLFRIGQGAAAAEKRDDQERREMLPTSDSFPPSDRNKNNDDWESLVRAAAGSPFDTSLGMFHDVSLPESKFISNAEATKRGPLYTLPTDEFEKDLKSEVAKESSSFENGLNGGKSKTDQSAKLNVDEEADIPYLDADSYSEASRLSNLDDDGSTPFSSSSSSSPDYSALKDLAMSLSIEHPMAPEEYYSDSVPGGSNGQKEDLALLQSLMQQQQPISAVSQDLHEQIFRDEQGFQSQSEVFRRSLSDGTNFGIIGDGDIPSSSKSVNETQNTDLYLEPEGENLDATAWRRLEQYRKECDEALELVDKEMANLDEWAQSTEETKGSDTIARCQQCSCLLSDYEIQSGTTTGRMICHVCNTKRLQDQQRQDEQSRRSNGMPSNSQNRNNSPNYGFVKNERAMNRNALKRTPFSKAYTPNSGAKNIPQRRPQWMSQQSRIQPWSGNASVRSAGEEKVSNEGTERGATNNNQQQERDKERAELGKRAKNDDSASPETDPLERIEHLETMLHMYEEHAQTREEELRRLQYMEERQQGDYVEMELQQPQEESGPWMKVIDPDTGEIFYWNEETDEMRLDE